jgi:hypothetical protein
MTKGKKQKRKFIFRIFPKNKNTIPLLLQFIYTCFKIIIY